MHQAIFPCIYISFAAPSSQPASIQNDIYTDFLNKSTLTAYAGFPTIVNRRLIVCRALRVPSIRAGALELLVAKASDISL